MSESVVEHSMEAEHGIQFSLFGALRDAIDSSQSAEEVSRLFDHFIDYTNVHFLSESLMMRLYNFPEYVMHESEHDHFMDKINTLRRKFRDENSLNVKEDIDELIQWLTDHVDGLDRSLHSFLREKRG